MLDTDIHMAVKPLFDANEIEIVEWSFDMGWGPEPLPDWCTEILQYYSNTNNLVGHGVSFSILSGQWSERQEWWLECLKEEIQKRNYCHISEHFGFMTAGDFHRNVPLPVPLLPSTLAIGKARLKQLSEICKVPIGLENLAMAFGERDVAEQGKFLKELVSEIDGFLVLDLHNIYCQVCNFNVDPLALIQSYPLDKVKEIHISGGRWGVSSTSPNKFIRFDTHDQTVPEEVFDLLKMSLPLCKNVEAVIYERIGNTIFDDIGAQLYREDFYRVKEEVANVAAR